MTTGKTETSKTEEAGNGAGTAWLLVGLTGSDKTTFAKRLWGAGRSAVVGGRGGLPAARPLRCLDFHESRWFALADPVAEEVYRRLGELVGAGRDVVLDHGLWTRADRDAAKKLVEAAGG